MKSSSTNIITSGNIRCSRLLSEDGSVTVFPGQAVDPSTQIAYRKIWRKHFLMNATEMLGIAVDENIRDFLTIKEGEFVSAGEVIAKRGGKKNQVITASVSSRFLGLSSGSLIFETDPDDIENVIAGFPGVVTDVVPSRGAYLETIGSYLQGIWGNGKKGQGILLSMDMEKGGIFGLDNISVDIAGAIVFANTCLDPEALRSSVKMSPGGLIFGSLSSSMLPVAMKMPFPIIVTDMIGVGRLNDPVHMVLGENIIRFAYLYSSSDGIQNSLKPEIIIPQEEYVPESENLLKKLKTGDQIRIIEGFHGGELGIVVELLPGMENDTEALSDIDRIKVCIDQNTEVVLPLSNVEMIHVK